MKKIILILSIYAIVALMPAESSAQQAINWNSITYEAEVDVSRSGLLSSWSHDSEVSISQTPTVSASASYEESYYVGMHADALASDSALSLSQDISVYSGDGWLYTASVAAGMWGDYTAVTNQLNMDYAFSYDMYSGPFRSSENNSTFSLTVTDITESILLYSRNYELLVDHSSADSIQLDTMVGNDIRVQIVASSYGSNWHNGASLTVNGGSFDASYSLSVAPEPVSTTLFILGGVFLAGRGYMRQRQNIT